MSYIYLPDSIQRTSNDDAQATRPVVGEEGVCMKNFRLTEEPKSSPTSSLRVFQLIWAGLAVSIGL
jgi:hypothetical protein